MAADMKTVNRSELSIVRDDDGPGRCTHSANHLHHSRQPARQLTLTPTLTLFSNLNHLLALLTLTATLFLPLFATGNKTTQLTSNFEDRSEFLCLERR